MCASDLWSNTLPLDYGVTEVPPNKDQGVFSLFSNMFSLGLGC